VGNNICQTGTRVCEGHDYGNVTCANKGCCSYDYDSGICLSAVGGEFCTTPAPTGAPTIAPTTSSPTSTPTNAPTLHVDKFCLPLMSAVEAQCPSVGLGYKCVASCEAKFLTRHHHHKKSHNFHLRKCHDQVQHRIRTDVCWPKDCSPVI
jgi:hypothetical protein